MLNGLTNKKHSSEIARVKFVSLDTSYKRNQPWLKMLTQYCTSSFNINKHEHDHLVTNPSLQYKYNAWIAVFTCIYLLFMVWK